MEVIDSGKKNQTKAHRQKTSENQTILIFMA